MEERLPVTDDERRAERHLEKMLMATSRHRNDLVAFRDNRNAFGAKRCERLLKLDYSLIRAHCAKHDLELPHDVPPEGAE